MLTIPTWVRKVAVAIDHFCGDSTNVCYGYDYDLDMYTAIVRPAQESFFFNWLEVRDDFRIKGVRLKDVFLMQVQGVTTVHMTVAHGDDEAQFTIAATATRVAVPLPSNN